MNTAASRALSWPVDAVEPPTPRNFPIVVSGSIGLVVGNEKLGRGRLANNSSKTCKRSGLAKIKKCSRPPTLSMFQLMSASRVPGIRVVVPAGIGLSTARPGSGNKTYDLP